MNEKDFRSDFNVELLHFVAYNSAANIEICEEKVLEIFQFSSFKTFLNMHFVHEAKSKQLNRMNFQGVEMAVFPLNFPRKVFLDNLFHYM